MLWNPCSLGVYGELTPVVGKEYIPGSIFILIHCLFPMFLWKIFISSNSALYSLVSNTSGPRLAHRRCVCATQLWFGQSLKATTELQLPREPCVPAWGFSSTTGSTPYLAQRVWCCAWELTELQKWEVKGTCCLPQQEGASLQSSSCMLYHGDLSCPCGTIELFRFASFWGWVSCDRFCNAGKGGPGMEQPRLCKDKGTAVL